MISINTKMLKLVLLPTLLSGCFGTVFQIKNDANQEIWVGIQGSSGKPALNNGGFILPPGQQQSVNSPDDWSGRIWGRTGCDRKTNHCETGDCGNKIQCNGAGGAPPATLAEITLKGSDGLDFYDISLVDGFNIQLSIEPIGGHGNGGPYSCTKADCSYPINKDCPNELKVTSSHGVIACDSACLRFHTDQDCCRGEYNNQKCTSNKYTEFFKNRCPHAYSYAYNDNTSTYTCRANTYLITIG